MYSTEEKVATFWYRGLHALRPDGHGTPFLGPQSLDFGNGHMPVLSLISHKNTGVCNGPRGVHGVLHRIGHDRVERRRGDISLIVDVNCL
jgi:hypothetical protein